LTTAKLVQVSTVKLVGPVRTGGVVSALTATVNVQAADWRHESVAVQFTGVVPRLNTAPEGGTHVTVGEAQPLDTAGAAYITVVEVPPQIQFVRFAGH